jgi:hypothetical protein
VLTVEERSFLDQMRVKHLPGQHNQLDHGHHGMDLDDVLDGLTVYDADDYLADFGEEVYGERTSESGIAPRFFESGDIHLALDFGDEYHQVFAAVESPSMLRDLASDLRAMLRTDVTRIEDDDVDEDGIVDSMPGFSGVAAARYDTGDVRLTALDEGVDLDISEQEAADLARVLDNVADVWEREFGTADGKTARRVRRKHLPGRHDQRTHGRHSAANRARQAAQELEELRESIGRAQGRDDASGPSAARWMSPDEAKAMRAKMLADQPWTEQQREALNRYSGDAYYGMNGLLRDDKETIADLSDDQQEEAKQLIRDGVQAMRPTTEPVKTKRFVAGFAAFGIDQDTMTREEIYDALRALKGKRLQEPGFSSMSLAENYGKNEWPGRIKLELEVPAGVPAAYLDGDVGREVEQELVTVPGTVYEWDEIIIDPPRNIMRGRVVVE